MHKKDDGTNVGGRGDINGFSICIFQLLRGPRSYIRSFGRTWPTMFSSGAACGMHTRYGFELSKRRGEGGLKLSKKVDPRRILCINAIARPCVY